MIYIASDHRGFEVKKYIKEYLGFLELLVTDLGPEECVEGDDYPDYAHKVCEKMIEKDFGILLCDTGIGMSIAANRYKHIRAALCSSIFDAVKAKEDDNANILVMGAQTNDMDTIKAMVRAFFDTEFSHEERHIRRINKI